MSEIKQEDFNAYLNLDVGQYHLNQLIGSGGMGAVFLATHNVLKKRVALKLLREQHRQDKETARNFFAEAKAAAGTGHENVIQVFDVDEDPRFGPFMVMEYLASAESLSSVIRSDGALSFSRIRKITLQIAGALSATHARGVVHCDLKPSNILLIKALGQTDVVKLIDFGIAKTINSSNQPNQGPKLVRGTPKYMSPEQVAGKPLDGRSDEYSLGILVYLMLTGVAPFSTGSPAETMRKQYYDPPPPVSEKRGDLPVAAEAVLLRALEKKPEARFPDILSFAQALSDALPPDEKEPERILPPLLIEEFASKDQEMFDGPSLIGLQAVPVAPPSETTNSPFKKTLPRMAVVQLPEDLLQPSPKDAASKPPPLFAAPQSAPSYSALESANLPRSAPSASTILSNEPSSLFPPLNAEMKAAEPEKLPVAPKAPEAPRPPDKPQEAQDIFNLGRTFSSSSIPIIKEDDRPGPSVSGSYELPQIEAEKPQILFKEAKSDPNKAEALHGPKRPSQDSGPSSAPYWLAFFVLVGCIAGWCYLTGFFGGFVLAMPNQRAIVTPQSTSAPASATVTPDSQPSKPKKKKKSNP
jgi:serine/threonine protein kinase